MQRIQGLSGKVTIKQIIIVIGVIVFALMSGFHSPLVVRYAHSKMKVGMTGDEVRNALRGLGRYHLNCETDLNVKDNAIFDDDKCFATISALPSQQQIKNVTMNILFMGPVFWHNVFFITFGPDGKVKEISPVRGWD